MVISKEIYQGFKREKRETLHVKNSDIPQNLTPQEFCDLLAAEETKRLKSLGSTRHCEVRIVSAPAPIPPKMLPAALKDLLIENNIFLAVEEQELLKKVLQSVERTNQSYMGYGPYDKKLAKQIIEKLR